MDQNVYAFTDQAQPYPGFVSLNMSQMGQHTLIVRTPGQPSAAAFPISHAELLILAQKIREHFGIK